MAQADSNNSNVVKFPYSSSRRAHARRPRKSINGTPEERATLQELVVEEIDARPLAGSLSTTGKDGCIRQERHEIWRMAEAATRYWRARLNFENAVWWAQRMGIPEGQDHPADPEARGRQPILERYRAALGRQLLTPAPDGTSVKWKQAALARGDYRYTGVKPERIERAIADDLAFLAAHPGRQSNRLKR